MHFYSTSRKPIELDPIVTDIREHDGIPFMRSLSDAAAPLIANAARSLFTIGLATGTVPTLASRRREKTAEPAAFREHDTGLVRMVYKEAVIRFRRGTPEQKVRKILARQSYQIRSQNRFVREQYVVFNPKETGAEVLQSANQCVDIEEVVFASPNFVSQYGRVQVPAFHADQWNLKNKASYAGQKLGEDINLQKAWKITTGSSDITIAVLDDGVDVDHPNLIPNIRKNPDPSEPKDLCGRDYYIPDDQAEHFNPRPKNFNYPYDDMRSNDIHGTACAGLIAAAGVNGGAVGVAPGCKILAVKIFHADKLAADERIADAIRYASLHADVLSCSWYGSLSNDVEMALEDSRELGRGGKGSVLIFASGNDSAAIRFPARHPEALAIGASTDVANFAYYSNFGPEQCVVGPSSGGVRGIFTTDDSTPNRGFNLGDAAKGGADGLHTNSFGGTSAATPQVAGTAALILSVNPSLDRDAVRSIIQSTAEKIGSALDYDAKGHSNRFGYGRLNAAAAVSAA